MNIFVYDGNPGRDWQKMLGTYVPLERAGKCIEGGNPIAGDVVVCHRVQHESIASALLAFAGKGVFVIEVGGDSARQVPPNGNYYRRAKAVSIFDHHFKACFRFFREHLEKTGTPAWRLLEGPPPPDALLAYHLLDLLPDDEVAVEARRRLAEIAANEVRGIAEATGIPPMVKLDNSEQRRAFLLACS